MGTQGLPAKGKGIVMDIKKLVGLYKDTAYLTMRVRHGR